MRTVTETSPGVHAVFKTGVDEPTAFFRYAVEAHAFAAAMDVAEEMANARPGHEPAIRAINALSDFAARVGLRNKL